MVKPYKRRVDSHGKVRGVGGGQSRKTLEWRGVEGDGKLCKINLEGEKENLSHFTSFNRILRIYFHWHGTYTSRKESAAIWFNTINK